MPELREQDGIASEAGWGVPMGASEMSPSHLDVTTSSGCHHVLTHLWFRFVPDLGSEDREITTQRFADNKVEVPCPGDGVTVPVATTPWVGTGTSLLLLTQH